MTNDASDYTTSLDSVCKMYGYTYNLCGKNGAWGWNLIKDSLVVAVGSHSGCLGNCQDHIEGALHDHRKMVAL